MRLRLVVGFEERSGSKVPEVLYCGADGTEALAEVNLPDAAFARKEHFVFSSSEPTKRVFFTDEQRQEAADADEAALDALKQAGGGAVESNGLVTEDFRNEAGEIVGIRVKDEAGVVREFGEVAVKVVKAAEKKPAVMAAGEKPSKPAKDEKKPVDDSGLMKELEGLDVDAAKKAAEEKSAAKPADKSADKSGPAKPVGPPKGGVSK